MINVRAIVGGSRGVVCEVVGERPVLELYRSLASALKKGLRGRPQRRVLSALRRLVETTIAGGVGDGQISSLHMCACKKGRAAGGMRADKWRRREGCEKVWV